ncbi:hypothetical protein HanIR_Chr13g0635401 [Helianthus annuus]|nr:hypothetical protein HanIR_Chr13g0635401 [Helianthus annuus]
MLLLLYKLRTRTRVAWAMLLFSSKQTRILRTTSARVQFRSKLKVALVDIHIMVVCSIVAIVLASATLHCFCCSKRLVGWLHWWFLYQESILNIGFNLEQTMRNHTTN